MQKAGYLIKKLKGFSLVEILLTVSIFTMTILAIASFLSTNDNSLKYSSQYNEANYYLIQGLEAVKNISDNSYSGLNNGTYGLMESASVWELLGSSDNVNGYTRKVIITSPDAFSKKATTQIQWLNANNQMQTISASLTLKNWNRYGATPTPTQTPTPTPIPCQINATIDITCDNEFILYLNGNEIGQDNNWETIHNYQLSLNTGKNVIAVKGIGDFLTAQALIAQITEGSNKYYTDIDWKVTKNYYNGWNTINFDASSWGGSTSYGSYGTQPWGTFSFPAGTLSKWIWTDAALIDSPVYFRFEFNAVCPPTSTPTPTPTLTPTIVPANWASPSLVINSDLTTAVAVVDMVKVGNYIYGVRTGTTNNFFIANVTNPAVPTYAYLTIAQTLTSVAMVNDPAETTVYVGSTNNAGEVYMINVTTKTAPALVGGTNPINLSGNDNTTSLWAEGGTKNRLYIGRLATANAAELSIYNITTRTTPTAVSTYNLAGGNYQFTNLYFNANYLYATTTKTTSGIHIMNVTTDTVATGTSVALTGSIAGKEITGYGTRLFVSGNTGASMFAYNLTTPTSLSLQGTYTADGVVNSIAIDQTHLLAFLGVTSTAAANLEFEAVNITSIASMTIYGTGYNPANNNSYVSIVYDSTADRCFIGTNITTSEFVVLRPGP